MLQALADALETHQQTLVPLADEETHLGAPRLAGEITRTAFQLRGFADQLQTGVTLAAPSHRRQGALKLPTILKTNMP
ncbi:hypothetical protein [Pseudomonas eucalypticola]|uniref:Uncharacterized protein n=1 Tax=Pseudomonas eucalypticola TaxID=2599595 RepID=A0A7D5D6T1_9PSED|nr:hypothetical protein [Pseudomonas eucalypticola]QKZ04218.1 hypothetical protein HWQ56_10660 [Pseudomonas eucalypticola]